MSDPRETMRERLLDTALREVTRRAPPADLAGRVRAALERDEPSAPIPEPGENVMEMRVEKTPRRWPWWLAAAAGLCLAVVLAVRGGPDDGPGPAETPPPPAWGEAFGGLQIGLDAERTTWAPGENLVFSVRARNVGEEPLVLELFHTEWFHRIRFESLDGQADWDGGAGAFGDYTELPTSTLEPGQAWSAKAEPYDGERRYLRIIPDRQPGDDWDYRDRIPPGRYRITVAYERRAPKGLDPRREGRWFGVATSNAIDIVIGAPSDPR
jgi:hypothetical protein